MSVACDDATFMVQFHGLAVKGCFIFKEAEELYWLIENHNKYGIDWIKELNHSKFQFQRVSKKRIRTVMYPHNLVINKLESIKYF